MPDLPRAQCVLINRLSSAAHSRASIFHSRHHSVLFSCLCIVMFLTDDQYISMNLVLSVCSKWTLSAQISKWCAPLCEFLVPSHCVLKQWWHCLILYHSDTDVRVFTLLRSINFITSYCAETNVKYILSDFFLEFISRQYTASLNHICSTQHVWSASVCCSKSRFHLPQCHICMSLILRVECWTKFCKLHTDIAWLTISFYYSCCVTRTFNK